MREVFPESEFFNESITINQLEIEQGQRRSRIVVILLNIFLLVLSRVILVVLFNHIWFILNQLAS